MKYFFLLFFFASTVASAATYTFTKTNNKVDWVAVGSPGFLRINGAGGSAEGALEAASGKVSGTLTVALDAYDTGIALRNEHMKDKYLDVKKYPTAKLVFKDQAFTEGKEGTATADLTIKDTTKPVQVTFTVTGKKVSGKFKVNLQDYPSIGVPSYLGITVANEVEVTIEASL